MEDGTISVEAKQPSLEFGKTPPVEMSPNSWLDAEYLEALCTHYPGKVPDRQAGREVRLANLLEWLSRLHPGVGGEVFIRSDTNLLVLSKQFSTSGLEILLPSRLARTVAAVKSQLAAGQPPGIAKSELIDLDTAPDLSRDLAVVATSQTADSLRGSDKPWRRVVNQDWRNFERKRTDAVNALGERVSEYAESPRLFVAPVYGSVYADERLAEEPAVRQLYYDYIQEVGYRQDGKTGLYAGSVPDVVCRILMHEPEPGSVDSYTELLGQLCEYGEKLRLHSGLVGRAETAARIVSDKVRIKQLRQARRELMAPVQAVMDQLLSLGFYGYVKRHRAPIDIESTDIEWMRILSADNIPFRPDDHEPELAQQVWQFRSHAIEYIDQFDISSPQGATEVPKDRLAALALDVIEKYSLRGRYARGYAAESEFMTSDFRALVLLEKIASKRNRDKPDSSSRDGRI